MTMPARIPRRSAVPLRTWRSWGPRRAACLFAAAAAALWAFVSRHATRSLRTQRPGLSRPRRATCLIAAAAALGALLSITPRASAASPPASVIVIPVAGAIDPASADFIVRGLARAAKDHAQLAVIQLDTPGGLDTSMRQIIQAILASPVPVAAFVAPGGARAASAGTYIVYAAHFAAMAPGTNLGAASPVQIGLGGGGGAAPTPSPLPASAPTAIPGNDDRSVEARKQMHDSAAYMRGLAQLRARNADWGERAVREAVSLSASEALAQKVVEVIAYDVPDLLRKLDGRTTTTADGPHTLATAGAPIVTLQPDWRSHFLAVVTDPNVALILLMIGMYGLFFEFANPGFVLPGVAGAISLLVGLFAMQLLPVNYVGLSLVLLGIAFLIAEAFLPTFGVLGFGGLIAFAVGALMLIDTEAPGYGIPLSLIAALAVFSALFVFGVSSVALRARRRPVVTGSEAMLGSVGVVLEGGLARSDVAGQGQGQGQAQGWAQVHGERWRAQSDVPLEPGAQVRVSARHGLLLSVAPLAGGAAPTARPAPTQQGEPT